MRALVIYWVVGCLLMGQVVAGMVDKCRRDDLDLTVVVQMVAIWPAIVVAAFSAKGRLEAQCKRM